MLKKKKHRKNKSHKKKFKGGNYYDLPNKEMWFDNNLENFDKQNNILYYDIPDELICNKNSISEKLIHDSQKIISEHQANSKHDQIEDIPPPKDMNKNN